MIAVEQALEAIDNLDDYARMDVGVDAVGPRELLISFVSQSAQLRAENERLKAEIAEAKKDAERWKYARRKICFTGNGDGTCMMHGINLPAAIPGWPDPGKVEEFCDAAIDAAMKGK